MSDIGSPPAKYAGYDYVQTGQPAAPEEGETWYDLDDDGAFVYDGAAWQKMDVSSHGELSGVGASDHHVKTTSASDLTDVSPDSDASAHHSKTTSASDLTDVSPDSDASAHHSRYSDGEARSAVDGASLGSLSVTDMTVGGEPAARVVGTTWVSAVDTGSNVSTSQGTSTSWSKTYASPTVTKGVEVNAADSGYRVTEIEVQEDGSWVTVWSGNDADGDQIAVNDRIVTGYRITVHNDSSGSGTYIGVNHEVTVTG